MYVNGNTTFANNSAGVNAGEICFVQGNARMWFGGNVLSVLHIINSRPVGWATRRQSFSSVFFRFLTHNNTLAVEA